MIRTNKRAALYARFSSDNQRTESIDAQIRAMNDYCNRNNIIIVNTYVDEAKSALTDKRPSFQKMISDSKNKTFDILLVHKLDRFARNRYDSAVYKRELKKNGVQVYSVLENLDDSPESIMLESVLEGMSEYYSQNLARETMKGMRETAYKTKHVGGKPPLGFDIDNETKKLIINEAEAETVKIIFDLYSKGYGYSYIITELNKVGRLTKKGAVFQKNSLYSILTNPKYRGTYVFNRSSAKSIYGTRNTHLLKNSEEIIAIDGGCPQIVDSETYDKVQKRLNTHKHKGGRLNAKTQYLLSGKVFCKDCGRSMVGNRTHCGRSKALYITYRCPNKRRYCSNKEINRDYLESYVVGLLEREVFSKSAMKRITKKIDSFRNISTENLQDKHDSIAETLAKTEASITNIADAIANGLISEALTNKLNELESERQQLLTELSTMDLGEISLPKIDGQMIISKYNELKDKPSSPEYKEYIQSFIDKIIVGKYIVDITLKTGLDIFPQLDTTYNIRRQEIYAERKKMV